MPYARDRTVCVPASAQFLARHKVCLRPCALHPSQTVRSRVHWSFGAGAQSKIVHVDSWTILPSAHLSRSNTEMTTWLPMSFDLPAWCVWEPDARYHLPDTRRNGIISCTCPLRDAGGTFCSKDIAGRGKSHPTALTERETTSRLSLYWQ